MENEQNNSNSKLSTILFGIFIIISIFGINKYIQSKKTTEANPAASNNLTKINIAYPALGTVFTGQIGTILEKTDILKQNGLDAKVTPYGTGREMKVAMVANQADLMLTSESVFLVMVGQGFDAYAIDSLGADGKMALVVNKDSKVKEVKDLKGKKVGTMFGTSPHKPAVEWVKQAGLTPGKDVEIVNLPNAEAIRTALAAKQVDAAVTWDPFATDGVNKDIHRVLVDIDMDLLTVMSKSFADANPEAIEKINNALKDAVYYLTQHKTEVSQMYSDNSKIDKSLIEQVSPKNKNYNTTTKEEINISISEVLTKKLQDISDFLFAEKLINKQLNVTEYIKQK